MLFSPLNIWQVTADAICITTNGVVKRNGHLVMGAGLAREAKQRYPDLPRYFGAALKAHGHKLHVFRPSKDSKAIIAFPSKHDWRDPSDLQLIERSAQELLEAANKLNWQQVTLPRVGCGLGQLDWNNDVFPVLREYLDNRFIICDFSERGVPK